MSDQEINIAIAQACGWTNVAHNTVFSGRKIGRGIFGNSPFGGEYRLIPDYCGDLNAMHEAEELFELSAKFGAHDYAANLYHICVPRDMQHDDHFICWVVAFYLLNATARQRAEAFLRTIGKWKEEA